ncbi:hypothetical protein [Methylobacter sp. BlB1]|uniref:hypothetical protein n=1 Tax=Methylobacter sp. BlB1 TaxID=2785914 RepID=UPI00189309B1|nr:hypothetical protein [Methylobacter sp. BlB1]MBF6651202.1 hypothetical protein [Methylobacter sp. BlB1]
MSSFEKMTIAQISKTAEDVRTIQKFQDESMNHGFNTGLISATVAPSKKLKTTVAPSNNLKTVDWPIICLTFFLIVFFCLVLANSIIDHSAKIEKLLLDGSLFAANLSVFSAYLKFKDITSTIILSIGLVAVITIGFNILTPKEAISEAKEMVKGTTTETNKDGMFEKTKL